MLAEDNVLDDVIKSAELRGAQRMLDTIRGSLEGYPNLGGDIEVMEAVDRIIKEAIANDRLDRGNGLDAYVGC